MGRSKEIGLSLEKRWSKKTNSRRTLASGAIWFDKEDSKNTNWLFQNKATDKDYFPLKLLDLTKLENNAKKTLRKFALVVEFNSSNYAERTVYVIFPYSYISHKLKENENIQTMELRGFMIKKQVKLEKEVLDENWLNDRFQIIYGKSNDDPTFMILNEIDFLKLFMGEFK